MDRLLVTGGARLAGTVQVSGAKNSALKLMAASLLAPGRSVITNVPRIRDCAVMAEMLEHLGVVGPPVATASSSSTRRRSTASRRPHELVRQIRASIVILGPLLARCGRARVALPGGDEIGARPVDLHVRGLERMGVAVPFRPRLPRGRGAAAARREHHAGLPERDRHREPVDGRRAAPRARTVIDNAAREPEIADLAAFLTAMGARVEGAGTSTIEIEGVDGPLHGAEHTAVPDRIEAGTWAAAAVATLGDVTVTNARPEHLELLLTKLDDAGADDRADATRACASARRPGRGRWTSSRCRTPGSRPTSSRSCWRCSPSPTARASSPRTSSRAGSSTSDELQRMGADIRTEGHHAVIRGVPQLSAAPVRALDIRAGMALVIAALCADGVTEISDVHHIDRGYEDLEGKLEALGADVRREGDAVVVPDPAAAR